MTASSRRRQLFGYSERFNPRGRDVSVEVAKVHAEQEFGKFRLLDDQRFESDFDHMVKRPPRKKPQ